MKKTISTLIVLFVIGFYLYTTLSKSNNPAPSVSPTPSTAISSIQSSGPCHAIQVNAKDPEAFLPDSNCTPGVVNPLVTQANLSQTVCKSGYTTTIRPPQSYTAPLKLKQIQEYGYSDTNPHDFEEDHFISLELGGSPKDPKNLWPEPGRSYNEKDKVENYLHKQLCSGQITLIQAQSAIKTNWYKVYISITSQ